MTEQTTDLAGRVRQALDAADLSGWISDTENYSVEPLSDEGAHIDVEVWSDGTWTHTSLITAEVERIVQLVRAVLAGGWQAEVAALGIVDTTDALLAECARRGWDPVVSHEGARWYADANQFSLPSPLAYADTPAEALARAFLAAHAAGTGEGAR